ncbi:hypothetical protein D3C85_1281440 [compost metagenome]
MSSQPSGTSRVVKVLAQCRRSLLRSSLACSISQADWSLNWARPCNTSSRSSTGKWVMIPATCRESMRAIATASRCPCAVLISRPLRPIPAEFRARCTVSLLPLRLARALSCLATSRLPTSSSMP